jgi:hypothetical protein
MSRETTIDLSVLDDIPDALIRPLLAISILETHVHTIEEHERLLNAINTFFHSYRNLVGESLYYVDIKNRLDARLYALRDAQTWAQQTDPTAEATDAWIDRWAVDIFSKGTNRTVLVEYESVGLNPETMEEDARPVITDADPADR